MTRGVIERMYSVICYCHDCCIDAVYYLEHDPDAETTILVQLSQLG